MHPAPLPSGRGETDAAYSLLTAQAVRTRAHLMLDLGLADRLPHFRVAIDRLEAAAGLVLTTTRAAYPNLDVPLHARWRHFVVAGEDRWAAIARKARWPNPAARARAACDLAIVSVLLDAGAGPHWRYHDAESGLTLGRSEGLALASLSMFARGLFSADPGDPLRVDAAALGELTERALASGLQVSAENPLVGLEGRVALLRRLGEIVAGSPEVFARADSPRPGGLFDHLAGMAADQRLAAPTILSELLVHLGHLWPSRLVLGGMPLGDCWRHPALKTGDATDGLVPLHKLSQWLAYSLVEPLAAGGLKIVDLDGLTGLAEYRNGGLFLDTGVLALREPQDADRVHDVGSPLVIEWRALTVALLDQLAARLRERLGMDATALPLAKVLEGGTWAAGRAIAQARRADGAPPLRIASDGTVF